MEKKIRIMSEKPLNAETPIEYLRSWITPNSVFFKRNQGEIMKQPIDLSQWEILIEGEVEKTARFSFDQIIRMPKAIVANTLECSGNGRSLLEEKASGNPWTIGGVGNAIWGGVWLRDLLEEAGLTEKAKYVAFEGLDTLLAYEMNGESLPLEHGYPLRSLALGWTGANCVKWLYKITVLDRPFEGFYMDNVYRLFQKDEDPKSGEVVKRIKLKSIITQPLSGETLEAGPITILGAAYAGEVDIERVEVSVDNGTSWEVAEVIGPHEPFAWRQWQFVWEVKKNGEYTIMARAIDSNGGQQPMNARWNVLGYGNNGVREHSVTVHIR